MEEGNDGVNSENGDIRSENDVEIEEISPPTPSKKSCFQILNELIHKFDIGETRYLPCDVKDSTNPLYLQLFHVSNNNITTGFSVIGSGGTRKEAKNDAARKLLLEMKKSTREGRTLISGVPKEEFVACCEWMERYATPDEELPLQPVEDRVSAGLLDTWLSIRRLGLLPAYEVLDSPVPGRQTYRISCKLNRYITEGSGRTKVIAKNIAARLMLKILESAEGDNRVDNDLP